MRSWSTLPAAASTTFGPTYAPRWYASSERREIEAITSARPITGRPERVRAEHGLGRQVVHHVLGVVLHHRDLLEHDFALRVDVGEGRLEDHVGHHVEGDVDVVVGDARVDDGRLARGGGVELPAHRVEQLGDLRRRRTAPSP